MQMIFNLLYLLICCPEYSCALQKDILVHGRLYVSQNYVCFYANIFGWETSLALSCMEITSVQKDRTAFVVYLPYAFPFPFPLQIYSFYFFISPSFAVELISKDFYLDP